MIDKTHRFQGHSSLRFVYQKGRIVRGPFSSLRYIINRRRQTYRLAVVVSRKVHKNAVVRNRIRRRIYEVIRAQEAAITQPYDLVLTIYSDQLASIPSDELRSAILAQCEKAAVLSETDSRDVQQHDIVEPKES